MNFCSFCRRITWEREQGKGVMDNKKAYMLAGVIALADTAVKGLIKEPPVKNYGFAGNIMDRHPGAVALVSVILTGVTGFAVAALPDRMKLPAALILGGALSNSADRLIRGYVVDYIPMNPVKGSDSSKRYYCNLSDLAIFAGAGIGIGLELGQDVAENEG